MKQYTNRTRTSRAKFKKEVLERDNYTCLACGFKGDASTLDAEHIIGRKSKVDEARAAGATVCSFYGRCESHRLKHDGKFKWKASQLPEECIKFIEWRRWRNWEGIIWDRP